MTTTQLLGVASGLVIVAFVWFAFRQGTRVKPDDRPDRGMGDGGHGGGD